MQKPNLRLNRVNLKALINKLRNYKARYIQMGEEKAYLTFFNSLTDDEWREIMLLLAAFNPSMPPSCTWKLEISDIDLSKGDLPLYFHDVIESAYWDTLKLFQEISIESRHSAFRALNQLCLTALQVKEPGFIQAIMLWPGVSLPGCLSTVVLREIIRRRHIFPNDDPCMFMSHELINTSHHWPNRLPHREYLKLLVELQTEKGDGYVQLEFKYLVEHELYAEALRCLIKLKKEPVLIMKLGHALRSVTSFDTLWNEISDKLHPGVKKMIGEEILKLSKI